MLTNYVNPNQTFMAIPNQDVVYGLGFLSLAKEPVVMQVPDFGSRFLDVPGVRRAYGRDQRAWVAIRHQARFLHGRGAELER